jgi:hypothetical protein
MIVRLAPDNIQFAEIVANKNTLATQEPLWLSG